MQTYLSIGTNIGDRKLNIKTSLDLISKYCGVILQKSAIYETVAWGFVSENNFYNLVVEVNTELCPQKLLEQIMLIEKKIGRKRKVQQYADRIIDIDILFYENIILQTETLTIPHPLLQNRNFVLYPMAEINTNFPHPILKKTIQQLKNETPDKSVAVMVKWRCFRFYKQIINIFLLTICL